MCRYLINEVMLGKRSVGFEVYSAETEDIILSMFTSCITVFGANKKSITYGEGSYNSATGKNAGGCLWDEEKAEQFLRISLYMAPREETNNGQPPSIDWSAADVQQIGKTFDWTSSAQVSSKVINHSNFTDAKKYKELGYNCKMVGDGEYNSPDSDGDPRALYCDTVLKTDWGDDLAFPKPINNTSFSGQYIKDYFGSRSVLNEVLWNLKKSNAGNSQYGINGITVDWLNGGYFIDDTGHKIPKAYLLIIEPGQYAYVNGVMSAYTLRDAIAWRIYERNLYINSNIDINEPLGNNPKDSVRLANSLTLDENTNYEQIGLKRGAENNNLSESSLKDIRAVEKITTDNDLKSFYGVGTIVYWGDGTPIEDPYPPLPIISYYYDSDDALYTDEDDMVGTTDNDDTDSNEGVQTNYELLSNPAHISKIDGKVGTVKIPMVSTEYTPKPADVKVEYVDENNKVIDKVTIDADEVEETLKNEKLEYDRDNNEDSVYKLRGLILLNTTADYGIGEIGAGGEKYRGCIGLTANSDKAIFNLEDKSGNILTA